MIANKKTFLSYCYLLLFSFNRPYMRVSECGVVYGYVVERIYILHTLTHPMVATMQRISLKIQAGGYCNSI